MNTVYHMQMFAASDPVSLSLRNRSGVVASVALAHVALLWFWVYAEPPNLPKPAHHEMSISMEFPAKPQAAPAETKVPVVVKPKPAEPRPVQSTPQVEVSAAPPATPALPVASSAPVSQTPPVREEQVSEPDSEPDYRAAYLNNPQPDYPMVARRMGWQGKVVLKVEVLSNGLPGQVMVEQSSGREILDKAARRAVLDWRFVAARQGGKAVTQWFLVPITFTLEGAA